MSKKATIDEQRELMRATRTRIAGRSDELQDSVLGFMSSGVSAKDRVASTAIRVGAVAGVVVLVGLLTKKKTTRRMNTKRDRARGREYAQALMKVAPEFFGSAAAGSDAPTPSAEKKRGRGRFLVGALVLAAGAAAGVAMSQKRSDTL